MIGLFTWFAKLQRYLLPCGLSRQYVFSRRIMHIVQTRMRFYQFHKFFKLFGVPADGVRIIWHFCSFVLNIHKLNKMSDWRIRSETSCIVRIDVTSTGTLFNFCLIFPALWLAVIFVLKTNTSVSHRNAIDNIYIYLCAAPSSVE